MGGLRKYLPLTAACYLIACVSISGVLFSGFYSKEMILSSLFGPNQNIYAIGFLIVSLMTAFYMFRSYFVVFEGEFKGSSEPIKPHFLTNLSISVLAIFTMLLGCFTHNKFEHFIRFSGGLIHNVKEFNPLVISIGVALTGIILAWMFYNTKIKPVAVPVLYKLSYNKFYIDNLYNYISEKIYYVIARTCFFIDKHIVDGLVVLTALVVRAYSWVFSKMQTGNFQSYLAYTAVFMALIMTALMFAYTVIINYSLVSTLGVGGA